jgi:phage-related protein
MKRLEFLGDSLAQLRAFPLDARKEMGVQLHKVQLGLPPSDWKPMTSVGAGVREVRVRDKTGTFRALYLANVGETVYVLHAFQKKTQQTSKRDLELAAARLGQL